MGTLGGKKQAESTLSQWVPDPGLYDAKLTRVFIFMGGPTEHNPEGAPKIAMIWAWIDKETGEPFMEEVLDAKGNTVTDKQGEAIVRPFEFFDAANLPNEFSYNEKHGYWKKLSKIAGTEVTKENVEDVLHDFPDHIETFDDIIDTITSPDPDNRDKKGKVEVNGITIKGRELIGTVAQLNITTTQGKKDPSKTYANIDSIILPQKSGPKAPPKRGGPKAPNVAEMAAQAKADLPVIRDEEDLPY